MPIKLGTNGLGTIYQGTNKIIAIYKGSDVVYKFGPSYINPTVVYDNQNTNIVYTATDNDLSTMAGSGSYYKIGTLTTNSSDTTTFNNGLISTSALNDTILYIPSIHNNTTVLGVGSYAFYQLINTYPNLTDIVLGEGIQKLGTYSLSFEPTNAVEIKPKIVLPKSLKVLWRNAILNLHIKEFITSNYLYYNNGVTDQTNSNAKGGRIRGCEVDTCVVDSSVFELDYASTTIDSSYSPISGSSTNRNTLNSLEFKTITKLGKYAIQLVNIGKLNFGSLNTLSDFAFYSATLPNEITFPATLKSFGSQCIPLQTGSSLIFKHSNSDAVTFSLDSSNYGPFYNKTAKSATVYTDNDYIHSWDFKTYDNLTVTFYHLDGTAW